MKPRIQFLAFNDFGKELLFEQFPESPELARRLILNFKWHDLFSHPQKLKNQ